MPEVKSALGVDEVFGYCRIHDESVKSLFFGNADTVANSIEELAP